MVPVEWTRTVKEHNQDATFSNSSMLCVVDGATPLDGDELAGLETAMFARLLADSMGEYVIGDLETESGLERAVQASQEFFSGQELTATLALASWDKQRVQVAVIGDSIVCLWMKSGEIVEVWDPQFVGREERFIARVLARIGRGQTPGEAYRSISEQLKGDRGLRNTPAGVWVVSSTGSAAEIVRHIHVESFPYDDIQGIVAVTDGCLALSAIVGLESNDRLLWHAKKDDLDRLFDTSIRLQRLDHEKTRFPRLSDQDDASLVRVRFL